MVVQENAYIYTTMNNLGELEAGVVCWIVTNVKKKGATKYKDLYFPHCIGDEYKLALITYFFFLSFQMVKNFSKD